MNNNDPKSTNNKPKSPFLYSKTNLKKNDQCSLLFYSELRFPDDKQYPETTLKLFGQGNKVDGESKKLFPNHAEIKARANVQAFNDTMKIIENMYDANKALLQACFIDPKHKVVVRVDILEPAEKRAWKMIEVKSSTKVKEDYYDDVLIQYYAAKNCGVHISSVEIWVIDKKNKLEFKKRDLTDFVLENEKRYYQLLNKAISTNNLKQPPKPTFGNHCEGCPFRWKCFKHIDKNPQHVANLPLFSHKWKAMNEGLLTIKDEQFKIQYEQYIKENPLIYRSLIENRPLIEFKAITKTLANLKKPLFFLDMEAISYAIPLIEDSLPYENILSQYSIHQISTNENNNKAVHWILDKTTNIDWDTIAINLLTELEATGTIVVWGQDLEIQLFRFLQKRVKDENVRKQLQAIEYRIFDLQLFFSKNVYHPKFLGKMNLKNISEILTDVSYSNLRIKNGINISKEFANYIEAKSEYIKRDLIAYNYKDVLATIHLFKWLFDMLKKYQDKIIPE